MDMSAFYFGLILGAGVVGFTWWSGAEGEKTKQRKLGFLDGWFARHRGIDLFPKGFEPDHWFTELIEFYGFNGRYLFQPIDLKHYFDRGKFKPYLSERERDLLSDPRERQHRNADRYADLED